MAIYSLPETIDKKIDLSFAFRFVKELCEDFECSIIDVLIHYIGSNRWVVAYEYACRKEQKFDLIQYFQALEDDQVDEYAYQITKKCINTVVKQLADPPKDGDEL